MWFELYEFSRPDRINRKTGNFVRGKSLKVFEGSSFEEVLARAKYKTYQTSVFKPCRIYPRASVLSQIKMFRCSEEDAMQAGIKKRKVLYVWFFGSKKKHNQ